MDNDNSDAILIEYLEAPQADLSAWTARYPAQARDLARLSLNQRLGDGPYSEASASRVHALGLSVLREKQAAYAALSLTSLKAAATQKGFTPDALAAALSIPVGLFWKLNRQLIAAETLPQAFLQKLAEKLDRDVEELGRFFRQPAQLQGALSFKSDSAPQIQQESFAVALQGDPETTESMRQAWL